MGVVVVAVVDVCDEDSAELVVVDPPDDTVAFPVELNGTLNVRTVGPATIVLSVALVLLLVTKVYTTPVRLLGRVTLPSLIGTMTWLRPCRKAAYNTVELLPPTGDDVLEAPVVVEFVNDGMSNTKDAFDPGDAVCDTVKLGNCVNGNLVLFPGQEVT